MNKSLISGRDIAHRAHWVEKLSKLSGDFGVDAQRVEKEVSREIEEKGIEPLICHLRLCGAIPERYGHDSSEEKLYSKYTDVIIHQAFSPIGLKSIVLEKRAGVADVECVCDEFSFVADAKAFRLSRTAKNQKDFKVQAVDNWKNGKLFAMVVCPAYQLPTRASQIYQQALTTDFWPLVQHDERRISGLDCFGRLPELSTTFGRSIDRTLLVRYPLRNWTGRMGRPSQQHQFSSARPVPGSGGEIRIQKTGETDQRMVPS